VTRSSRVGLAVGLALAAVAAGIVVGSGNDETDVQPKTRAARPKRVGSSDRHRVQRGPEPKVPDVVGLRTTDAVRRLDRIGLEFEVQGQCEGMPPAGRVVLQNRVEGVHRSVVNLYPDHKGVCSRRSTQLLCRPGDLKLEAAAGPTYFGSGVVTGRSIGFSVKNIGPKPCQLRTHAEVSVLGEGASRPAARIRGNPASFAFDWRLDRRLDPGENSSGTKPWTISGISSWENWCGGRGDLTVRVRVGLGHWRDEIRTKPPRCGGYEGNRPSLMF
jgi:hypothetical protein